MNTFFPSRLLGIATMAALIAGTAGLAQAATTGATLPVSATVPLSCAAAAGTSMAFGTLNTTSLLAVTETDATGTITVTCSGGVSYSIVAGNGNNYSSGWRMVAVINGVSKYVTYNLYSDSGRGTAFPRSGTALNGSGSGSPQTVTIYGRVPAQTAGDYGNFTDSVTFTVTY